MAFMFKHSSVGAVSQLISSKKISFSRGAPKDVEDGSTDEVSQNAPGISSPIGAGEESEAKEISGNDPTTSHKLVHWVGEG